MTDSISQALKQIKGRRVLVVGDVMLDSYVFGETMRVSREAPVIVVRKECIEYRLGGAANTALNLAALGVQVEILAFTGEDEAGRRIRTQLQQRDVDISGVFVSDMTTPVKTRIMAGAVGTGKQQVLRIDDEPDSVPHADFVAKLIDELAKRSNRVDAIILSDYDLGVVDPEIIEVTRRLVKQGLPVCVDSRHRLHLFKGMTIVTPNVPEAEEQIGTPITSHEEALKAGEQLLEELESEACLLTQGRGGMTLFARTSQPSHVDIIGEDQVTDVTGAGDTVIAAFAAAIAAGLGMENAMRFANCAAGIVVGKAGAAVAQPDEIMKAAIGGDLELIPWEG